MKDVLNSLALATQLFVFNPIPELNVSVSRGKARLMQIYYSGTPTRARQLTFQGTGALDALRVKLLRASEVLTGSTCYRWSALVDPDTSPLPFHTCWWSRDEASTMPFQWSRRLRASPWISRAISSAPMITVALRLLDMSTPVDC